MKQLLFATALFMAIGFSSSAQTQTIKQHAKHQTHRIKNGVHSGELTKAETKNLVKDQREIHQDIKEARADGTFTKAERKAIKKEQRKERREIARKKHNDRDRG
ncbi:MAG: hypothetical protein ABIX01_12020 [Chitinophagaceae bacterium]